jgi:hypothetical protein
VSEDGEKTTFKVRIIEKDEEKEGNEAYSIEEKEVELKKPEFITKKDQMKLISSGAMDQEGNLKPEKLDDATDEIIAINFINLEPGEVQKLNGDDFGELLPKALENLGMETENFTQ